MSGIQSLHCHTTTSDGLMSHMELLDAAHHHGLSTIAFTDHDSLPSQAILDDLMARKNHPCKWISGIEISCTGSLHITGLFIDPTNAALLDHCSQAQAARLLRMEKMVTKLQALGFRIEVADCLRASGGESVGRPHIVQALRTYPENDQVEQQLLSRMAQDPSVATRYQQLIESGPAQYPYVLYLSEDSYVPNMYVETTYSITLDQVVSLIRQAGGLAFVAHYSTAKKVLPLDQLELLAQSKSVDGMETIYGTGRFGTAEEAEWEQDRKLVSQLVTKHNLLASGGSDIHTLEHITSFVTHTNFSSGTIGMAEKIIATSGVSTTWSSF